MKIKIKLDVKEVERSTFIREWLGRLEPGSVEVHVGAASDEDDEVEAPSSVAAPAASTDDVPGVDPAGQAMVKSRLAKNPAPDLFRTFLETVISWGNVEISPIKPKGKSSGAPVDFSRYLRLNKLGSDFGAFVYVWPHNGLIELRLSYPSDTELHAIAPAAWRYLKSNPMYSVSIRITDQATLEQAVDLARRAYDLI